MIAHDKKYSVPVSQGREFRDELAKYNKKHTYIELDGYMYGHQQSSKLLLDTMEKFLKTNLAPD